MNPPSPFHHVLQSNYAPSQEELKEIEALISEPEKQVQLLNEKISQLQAERNRLQKFIDNHRALLSPARRLPRDIIAEVFLHCLPVDQLPTCDASEAPLVLTTVCRSWREIAITTPRLWRAIHFILPPHYEYTINDKVRELFHLRKEGLQLWLSRTGSVPLTISCYGLPLESKPWTIREALTAMYTEYLEILSQYSARWKTLYLSNIPRELLSPFQVLKANDVPLLSALSLEANGFEFGRHWTPVSGDLEHPLHNITRTSSLRVLSLLREWADTFTFPICWSNLTELHLCPGSNNGTVFPDMNAVEIVQRLGQTCRSLRKCKLDLFISDFRGLSSVHCRHTWPHLSELSIQLQIEAYGTGEETGDVHLIRRIFEPITTPALSHLSLHVTSRRITLDEMPFLDFLQVSQCPIVSLALDLSLSGRALIEGLQAIPSLTAFHLKDVFQSTPYVSEEGEIIRLPPYPVLTSDVLRSLSNRALCPFLEEVILECCPAECMDDVVAFALARSSLKLLNVTYQERVEEIMRFMELSEEDKAKGERLRQTGMDVHWHSIHEIKPSRVFNPTIPQSIVVY
ncbi:hypothetical protein VNI00_013823 [Paramarasmius palmivorus]|uniref:F-box domain-containing protein n=1 Tax=Paramarasmius palmivorus TaxID=297713 RepID=A0AAW0BWL2_9AGAR